MNNNTLNTFITDFKTSGIVEQICKDYEVIMIWISGSQISGLVDDYSDYDIGILVADDVSFSKTVKTPVFYKYKKDSKNVQCIFNNLQDIYSKPSKERLAVFHYLGWAQFRLFSEEHIIYRNNKYTAIINTLIKNKIEISDIAIYAFLNLLQENILRITTPEDIKKVYWGKMLSHILWAVNILNNNDQEFSKITKLKRTEVASYSDEELQYAFNKLNYVQHYLKSSNRKELNISFIEDN